MSNLITSAVNPESLSAEIKNMVVNNSFSRLTEEQRTTLIWSLCNQLKMNPLSQPFQFIQLGRGLVLYATKDAANQLKKLHRVSVKVEVFPTDADGIMMVHAQASMPCGLYDEDMGGVVVKGLRGDDLINARLKAVTKAKRRVTLSICGLGFLDENEVQTVKDVDAERKGQEAEVIVPEVVWDKEVKGRAENIKFVRDLVKATGFGFSAEVLKMDVPTLKAIFDSPEAGDWDFLEVPKESLENLQLKAFTRLIQDIDWNSDMSEDPGVRQKFNADLKIVKYFRENALSNNIEVLYKSASA